jgi:hypothetical protein
MRSLVRHRATPFGAILVASLLTGCVTVRPHQRQHLGKREMNPALGGEEELFQSHVETAREGAMGGHGRAGGGCGCG